MHLELSESYEVIDTGEPEQGLALALEHMPDAILLDLRLPKYSGYELCQTFTSFSRTQTIPVVIVSGGSWARRRTSRSPWILKPLRRAPEESSRRPVTFLGRRCAYD